MEPVTFTLAQHVIKCYFTVPTLMTATYTFARRKLCCYLVLCDILLYPIIFESLRAASTFDN